MYCKQCGAKTEGEEVLCANCKAKEPVAAAPANENPFAAPVETAPAKEENPFAAPAASAQAENPFAAPTAPAQAENPFAPVTSAANANPFAPPVESASEANAPATNGPARDAKGVVYDKMYKFKNGLIAAIFGVVAYTMGMIAYAIALSVIGGMI